jgi:hypothetical protein
MDGGYAWGEQDPFNIITDRFDSLSADISGGVFGGTFGAQIQAGHVVMGLEADIDWANTRARRLPSLRLRESLFPEPGSTRRLMLTGKAPSGFARATRTITGYSMEPEDSHWLGPRPI